MSEEKKILATAILPTELGLGKPLGDGTSVLELEDFPCDHEPCQFPMCVCGEKKPSATNEVQ